MAVKTKCPHCGKLGKVRDEAVGKKGRCNDCRKVFVVKRFVEPEPTVVESDPGATVRPDKTIATVPAPPPPAPEPGISPFADGNVPSPHESWGAGRIRPWQFEPKDSAPAAAADRQVPLDLRAGDGPSQIAHRIRDEIVRLLTEEPDLRTQPVAWNVVGPEGRPLPECTELVRQLWDGMRPLPYANRQIATCIGNYIALQGGQDGEAVVEEMFGPHLGLALGSGESRRPSRASVSGLRTSFRTDMSERMAPWHPSARDIRALFATIADPTRLFDFPRLAELFAREIIPNQLLLREPATAILFSPSQLSTIGNS